MTCDMNCASCMEECENKTVFLNESLEADFQKGVCQTGKFPRAKCFEKITSGEAGWERQTGHFLDEVVEEADLLEALNLADTVFMDCEARYQTKIGIEAFRKVLKDSNYTGHLRIYTAKADGFLVGMGATRSSGTQLALLYVLPEKQKQGIGRALFERMLTDDPMEEMQVHAAPAAESFYRAVGFEALGELTEEDGMRYVPMHFVRKRI